MWRTSFTLLWLHLTDLCLWSMQSPGINSGNLTNCIFKGILINSRGSCHSSAAIKGNRMAISGCEGKRGGWDVTKRRQKWFRGRAKKPPLDQSASQSRCYLRFSSQQVIDLFFFLTSAAKSSETSLSFFHPIVTFCPPVRSRCHSGRYTHTADWPTPAALWV